MKRLALSIFALTLAVSCTKSADEDLNIKELTPQLKEKAGLNKWYYGARECSLGAGHCVMVDGEIHQLWNSLTLVAKTEDIKEVLGKELNEGNTAPDVIDGIMHATNLEVRITSTDYADYFRIYDVDLDLELLVLPKIQ